jgi:two-component system alkaline phosphatase synthesis response regulator PhoP
LDKSYIRKKGKIAQMSRQDTKADKKPFPRVLIVDDNQQNLELLQAYLDEFQCQTLSAYDGPEALKIIRNNPPDLILLDIMMPQMSGFEVCRRIKNDPKTADIPVIMVTALNETGDIEKAVDSGADDFLSKPVNKWELITRVKTMLKLRHLTDRLERTLAYLGEIEAESHKTDPVSQ